MSDRGSEVLTAWPNVSLHGQHSSTAQEEDTKASLCVKKSRKSRGEL